MTDRSIVFEEDFSDHQIGVIGGNYSPDGEYHVVPSLADTFRWRETFIHHKFFPMSRGNWQVIAENNVHVLEQTIRCDDSWPLLAAGDPVWTDATVKVSLRPLTLSGIRGLAFRYVTGRRFYAVLFEEGHIRVIRRDNTIDTVLGTASGQLDPDRFAAIAVDFEGSAINVSLDSQPIIACSDKSQNAFYSGCIALCATNLTRFSNIKVSARIQAPVRRTVSRSIVPKLWRKIPTPHFGTDRNLRLGDIDGDGEAEILLATRTDRLGGDNCSSIASLAAYKLTGELIWKMGEPGHSVQHTTSDLPFQLHDWNGDGACEVVYCQDWELLIAQGSTGKILARTTLPRHPSGDGKRVYRIFGDSLLFCDLSGLGKPDHLILKDRYKNAWALDKQLNCLWGFQGSTGHYPIACDIDNDGCDELLIGHSLLDQNGEVLWGKKFSDHADSVAIIPATASREARILIASGDAGLQMLNLQGEILMDYPIGHAQCIYAGRLAGALDDFSFVCNTFWGAAGITAVFSMDGTLRSEFEPMPYACLLQPVNWCPCETDERAADLILLSTHPRQGGLIDAKGDRVVMFPDDGHPVLCSDSRDIDGDGIDEILTWNEEEIWIYKADIPGRTTTNYPRRNAWYNDSNYRAQYSLPFSISTVE